MLKQPKRNGRGEWPTSRNRTNHLRIQILIIIHTSRDYIGTRELFQLPPRIRTRRRRRRRCRCRRFRDRVIAAKTKNKRQPNRRRKKSTKKKRDKENEKTNRSIRFRFLPRCARTFRSHAFPVLAFLVTYTHTHTHTRRYPPPTTHHSAFTVNYEYEIAVLRSLVSNALL